MGYFPLCMNLSGQTVLCVGSGKQIQDKIEKLQPFGAKLVLVGSLEAEVLAEVCPVFVVVGDTEFAEAERISLLCRERNIPVNVVDVPALCSFYFPALITRGDVTVSVSTAGKSPAAAAYLKKQMETFLPDTTGEILAWLEGHRAELRERGILKEVVATAFSLGRPLTEKELVEF